MKSKKKEKEFESFQDQLKVWIEKSSGTKKIKTIDKSKKYG